MKKYETPTVDIDIFKTEDILQISGATTGALMEDDMAEIDFGD